jgi:hypothetical protein
MKTLALDTNAYSGFKHGKAEVVDQLDRRAASEYSW